MYNEMLMKIVPKSENVKMLKIFKGIGLKISSANHKF